MFTRTTHTHTYAIIEVSDAAHKEIKEKIEALGPEYAREYILDDGNVILPGVALQPESKRDE